MNYHLEISAGAENDIKASFLWYEEQQNGLGEKFESIISSTFKLIQKNPFAYQTRYEHVRIAFSKKFSFGVHFSISNHVITIHAVLHTSRSPKNWKKR